MGRPRPAKSYCRGLSQAQRAYPGRTEDGKPTCRWCRRGIVDPVRRTFCGPACVHEFLLRSDPGYARQCVFARDRGVCAGCGTDTVAAAGKLLPEHFLANPMPGRPEGVPPVAAKRFVALGTWECDHVLEVARGGGGCSLENLQTLCPPCHKKKTATLHRWLAEHRRKDRVAPR